MVPSETGILSLRINSQLHEISVSLTGMEMMYFHPQTTLFRSAKADSQGQSGHEDLLPLYQFDWENVRELPFNSDEYSCMHPALSSRRQ